MKGRRGRDVSDKQILRAAAPDENTSPVRRRRTRVVSHRERVCIYARTCAPSNSVSDIAVPQSERDTSGREGRRRLHVRERKLETELFVSVAISHGSSSRTSDLAATVTST